jgi:hypothetical protein
MSSALSGIFKASYLLMGLARSNEDEFPVRGMHHQLLNDAAYSGYGRDAGLTRIYEDGTLEVSAAGQIVSHLSWLALDQSTRFRRVVPRNCGGLGFEVNREDGLSCLQAVAFDAPTRIMPFYAVINRCSESVEAIINTADAPSHLNFRNTIYDWDMRGNGDGDSSRDWKKVDLQSEYNHPWNSPLEPRTVEHMAPLTDETMVLLNPLSLSIIDFYS